MDTDQSSLPERSVGPERLHQQIRLIAAPTWLLTFVLLGVTAGALVWAIYGTVLVQVSGRGLLVAAGSRQVPVFAIEDARLVRTVVSPGEPVASGQVLFELDQPMLDLQLKLATRRLGELRNVLKTVSDSVDSILAQQERVTNDRLAAIDEEQKQLRSQVDYFSGRLSDLQGSGEDAGTAQGAVETARESLDSAALQLARSQAQRATIEGDLLQGKAALQRQKVDAQLAVDAQQAVVDELRGRLDLASRITAHTDGYVSEIVVTTGQQVAAGARVAVIGTRGAGYEVLAFFNPLDGQRVQVGMAVDIVPSTVKREEYGTMEGTVSEVSSRPISIEEAVALLGNKVLARYLTGDEPPMFARIKVAAMPDHAHRFVWRNGTGPPFPVTAGTVAAAEVTVQEQAPISLVLPYLDRLLGL